MLKAMPSASLRSWLSLLLAALLGAWMALAADAQTPPTPAKDARGWSPGQVAAQTGSALTPPAPVEMDLPERWASRVKRDTAFFYFSPSCPHCQHAMPEINALAAEGRYEFIGVALGSATDEELAAFKKIYKVKFDLVADVDRSFARATGARSTPSLYLVRPLAEKDRKTLEHMDPGHQDRDPVADVPLKPVMIYGAYPPYRRGSAALLRLLSHPEDPFRDFHGLQGDVVCAACHTQESRSWALTHHSVAYRTLYQRDRQEDTACVGCHVTGLGQPGGFELGDHSSPLADVTCEACHSPSGPHDGERVDARAACVGCHDDKHSVAFTVEKGLPFIDHFAANGLTDAELMLRLEELSSGEADRPLLAFPEGPTVGAAACQGCHAEVHADWAASPHGKAMSALGETDRAQVGCVACHATPAASGPLPDSLDSYRRDESVGCEACHGPGGAHVADPKASNIIGLGESCPECVIESICTTCHTRGWDPNWELKSRLEAARHAKR